MKLIEAMKEVKHNKEKVIDLQQKIKNHCANLSHETPMYGSETKTKVNEWLQSCTDLSQRNVDLLCAIQRTNLKTLVSVDLNGTKVTKSISAWVWRRREYALLDQSTWSLLTDRGLKEGSIKTSTETPFDVKLVRHFDPVKRDEKVVMYKSEPHLIDSALEITNAVTDLVGFDIK